MKKFVIQYAILLIILTSCASTDKMNCKQGLEQFEKVSLYFGTSYPGGIIPDSLWQNFVDEVLVPQFPEGMSIYDTAGYWMSPEGNQVSEPGKMVVHLYERGAEKDENIKTIIAEFKSLFMAHSVLREENVVCASF